MKGAGIANLSLLTSVLEEAFGSQFSVALPAAGSSATKLIAAMAELKNTAASCSILHPRDDHAKGSRWG